MVTRFQFLCQLLYILRIKLERIKYPFSFFNRVANILLPEWWQIRPLRICLNRGLNYNYYLKPYSSPAVFYDGLHFSTWFIGTSNIDVFHV